MRIRPIQRLMTFLASDTRRRILIELGRKPSAANDLAHRLAIPVSTVRHQLGLLRRYQLVVARGSKSPSEYRLGRTVHVLFTQESVVLRVQGRDRGALTLITPMNETHSTT